MASAHARAVKVVPGVDAVVTAPPNRVEIVVSQAIDVRSEDSWISVVTAEGVEVSVGDLELDFGNHQISVALRQDLEPGVYAVTWSVLSSDDGDVTSNDYRFTVDPEGVGDPGIEVLQPDVLSAIVGASAEAEEGSIPWILIISVAAGATAIGVGGVFLLGPQKSDLGRG